MALFSGQIYGGVGQLGAHNKAGAASVSWWLTGGISAANCIAAYQPKGAANYAASKINLANPGTYNAVDGAAFPTWDGTSGWKFAAASSQYIGTGVIPQNANYTMMIRYSNLSTYGVLAGCRGEPRFYIHIKSATQIEFNHGNLGAFLYDTAPNNAVVGIVGIDAYLNGSDIGDTVNTWANSVTKQATIGAINRETGVIDTFISAYVQAFAIYDTVITAAQAAGLSTAMAAL